MANPALLVVGGLIGVGGLVTAIAVPQLISSSSEVTKSQTIEKKETRKKVDLQNKEDFEKNCLLIARNNDRAILACKKFNSGSEVDFYLYKKEGEKATFLKIKQIDTEDQVIMRITPLNPESAGTKIEMVIFLEKQEQWINSINRSPLEGKCQVDWVSLGEKKLKVECDFQQGEDSVNVGEFAKFSLTQIG